MPNGILARQLVTTSGKKANKPTASHTAGRGRGTAQGLGHERSRPMRLVACLGACAWSSQVVEGSLGSHLVETDVEPWQQLRSKPPVVATS